ncbi:hypothetical protein [Peribacillus glennii]|nr:hypothetical protein [Peribacillus glennii]
MPNGRGRKPGALQKGSTLQAAAIEEISSDSASSFYT